MIILEKGERADPLWGMDTEIITDEMIEALEQGKRLYLSVNDEYAVVIKKDGKRKTDKPEATDTDTISRQAEPNKGGRWEMVSQLGNPPTYVYRCSECHHKVFGLNNFCPNCGADMRP